MESDLIPWLSKCLCSTVSGTKLRLHRYSLTRQCNSPRRSVLEEQILYSGTISYNDYFVTAELQVSRHPYSFEVSERDDCDVAHLDS